MASIKLQIYINIKSEYTSKSFSAFSNRRLCCIPPGLLLSLAQFPQGKGFFLKHQVPPGFVNPNPARQIKASAGF
jgi:hypothetical protein